MEKKNLTYSELFELIDKNQIIEGESPYALITQLNNFYLDHEYTKEDLRFDVINNSILIFKPKIKGKIFKSFKCNWVYFKIPPLSREKYFVLLTLIAYYWIADVFVRKKEINTTISVMANNMLDKSIKHFTNTDKDIVDLFLQLEPLLFPLTRRKTYD
ncbi:hypothetical protein [Citrobacter koseri]|uniref:hypothetical protein n=1 Tax=Citrobacter koseri TaxID=545 RepID=UPI003891B1CC